mgnify:CR=1 FL=1
MVKNNDNYDLVILGGGPAGLTAALYAGRYNLKVAVVAKTIGGTANLAGEIENWPGYIGSGMELMKKFKDQAEKFGAVFIEEEVKKVSKKGGEFLLEGTDKKIRGRALIVALGTEHRQLNIPGEKELLGKGVSYCATCDGNFFRGKDVAVIGGANSAARAAIYLADIAKKVYVIYRRHEMRCEPIALSKICSTKNVEIIYFSEPTEVEGDGKVSGLKIIQKSPDKDPVEKTLAVEGVFIEAGATPAKEVIADLKLKTEKDYIVTGKGAEANVEGIFAAGDITNNNFKQVVTAASEGAIAAKSAFDYLKMKGGKK